VSTASSVPGPQIAVIAEDSRIQAKVLERLLMQVGYQVFVAPDGKVGVELAAKHRPHVIVSDIEMPRMTGYEFCRTVKNDPALRSIPFILLSTLSDPEDIIKGLDCGADNYVTKPYDPHYLLARIDSLRKTPLGSVEDQLDLTVTLAGRTYRVRSGRQQTLNLLISTFENAVEKNRELHAINEQLTLAKEKLTQWNQTLESLNIQLESANSRMSRDLHAAARVQQSLLPSEATTLPRVQVSWKYTPCEELAGDFLNYFALDPKHVALYVVDVSGHGAASSLLAVAIGRLITAQISQSSILAYRDPMTGETRVTPPARVAEELNRRFPMEAQNNLYFTICYGILNLETLKFRYVSAGHPPMVHLPQGGEAKLMPAEGFAIGIVDDVPYDEVEFQLHPGDRLYLYSDGVPEGMDENLEQFTDGRMLESLDAKAASPLSESVDELFARVQEWCKVKGPKDDISILGLEVG
jgi:phosphoserine phosphatase RsbU/P